MIKIKKIVAVAMLFSILFSLSAFAMPIMPPDINAKGISDTISYVDEKEARVSGSPRGSLISSVDVRVSDAGNGVLSGYADIFCHKPMAKIKVWLYFDQLDEETEAWTTLEIGKFEWKAEDFPDEELTVAVVNYNSTGNERGRYYRVRGVFGAYDLNSKLQEFWSVETPDFYLE